VIAIGAALLSTAAVPAIEASAATNPPTCTENVHDGFPGQPSATIPHNVEWSANGRYVVFSADTANGLTDTNGTTMDVMVRDRQTGALEIASKTTAGAQLDAWSFANQISNDGRYVLFTSYGAFVATDTNNTGDLYLRDRQAQTTERVSVGSGGSQLPTGSGNGRLSADGRYVVFTTDSAIAANDTNNTFDIYRFDRVANTTVRVSVYDDETSLPLQSTFQGLDVSANVITFITDSPFPGSTDPFPHLLRDIGAGTTTLLPAEGVARLSPSGTALVINTYASHSPADTNGLQDAYLYDIAAKSWTLLSDRSLGIPQSSDAFAEAISSDNRFVLLQFVSANWTSLVLDRTANTLRYGGAFANRMADDGSELMAAQGVVSRVGMARIDSIAPLSIMQGTSTTVTINGYVFAPGTTVDFGAGLTVSNVTFGAGQATMTVTSSAAAVMGPRTVTVTQPNGCQAKLESLFNVQQAPPPPAEFPAPLVTGVSPALIRPNAFTPVHITGSNFQDNPTVSSPISFSGVARNSSTQLVATANSFGVSDGIKPITVTNPDNKSAALQQAMLVRSSKGEFHSVLPGRILDTRATTPLGAGSTRDVQVTGMAGVPSTGVRAVLLNVTVTGPTAPSYLTIFPTGSPRPTTSSLNYVPGQTVPNMVTATVGSNGRVTIYNDAGAANVIFDVVGWYSDAGAPYGGTFVGISPTRILDTRFDFDTPLGPLEYISLPIVERGSPVSAVMMNVTVTGPTAPSYLTIWPSHNDLPVASSLNFVPGQTVPNLVVSSIGTDGAVNILNFAGETDVIVDVVGFFEDGTVPIVDGQYEAVQPFRALDTRIPKNPGAVAVPMGAQGVVELDTRSIGVPDDASVLMMNVTVTGPTVGGYVTVYPGGEPLSDTSNLNFTAGQTVPNAVAMRIGADRKIKFYNAYGTIDLIVDVTGWYRPGYAADANFMTPQTASPADQMHDLLAKLPHSSSGSARSTMHELVH
jgi:hypothetical protein